MVKKIKKILKPLLKKEAAEKQQKNYEDFSKEDFEIIHEVAPYTSTGPERIVSLVNATKHIIQHNIKGSFVECGVWKGGSMMAILRTLKNLEATDREIYLYDTFEGMPQPSEHDGLKANQVYTEFKNKQEPWTKASLEDVLSSSRKLFSNTDDFIFIKGKVENTLIKKSNLPEKISLLRLDTLF